MTRSHRRVVAVLALSALALTLVTAPGSSAAAAKPGARAHASVVGGGPANPADWPYVVAIFRKSRLHCGGSVIAPTKVLTAAHCVQGFNLANFTVIVGKPDLGNPAGGSVIGVIAAQVHPDYTVNAVHDMAVLTLAAPANVTPIAPATVAEDAPATVPGAIGRVAGWGATNPLGFRLSRFLKATLESIRDSRKCLRAYTPDLFNPEAMLCALGRRIRHSGRPPIHTSACSGDSGGPLVADTPAGPRQIGIVSFGGAFCGLAPAPTVYSRVSSGLDFIGAASAG